jgi:hypothetical protein
MVYNLRYSRSKLHPKMLALVVRITRIKENERHWVQVSRNVYQFR